ncbi:MAG: N-acetyltransferase [Verrucomicrobia bacterium]|nr:N-acetyltransferase [Verrucomicrobiota bacterium]MCH8511154.1 N-acetyltransferase [Kiritimatiellia bacterium]
MNAPTIRPSTPADLESIRQVHLHAFPESENERVARLALELCAETGTRPTVSLLAEQEGKVVGHVVFSPVTLTGAEEVSCYTLAPLGVMPDMQKRGIGTGLVKAGLKQLENDGVQLVFVYGDPAYYGRFGFSQELARTYVPPYPLSLPFGWQALAFSDPGSMAHPIHMRLADALSHPDLW